MSRNIEEGDIVSIYMNDECDLERIVWHGKRGQFRVVHRPQYVGDLWYFEGWIGSRGIYLAINPNSADFDGIVKELDKEDALAQERNMENSAGLY